MQTPTTKIKVEYDELEGIKVPDPYRWLENIENGEVKTWVQDQNEYTDFKFPNSGSRIIAQELEENYEATEFLNTSVAGGKYFYRERKKGEDQMVLYATHGIDGEPVRLVDPNGIKEGNTVTMDYWKPSPKGRYVAYGVSEDGAEMATLYIKDVELNKDLEYSIPNCRYSKICWLSDESGFYYTRNPRPGEVPVEDEHMYSRIFFHRIGNDPNSDELIFGKDRPKDDMVGITLSLDDKFLAINASQEWDKNDIYIYNTQTKETISITEGVSARFRVTFLSDRVLISTDHEAPNYKVLSASLGDFLKSVTDWSLLVPETEHVLDSLDASSTKILVHYLVNVSSVVKVFSYGGKEIEKLPIPELSSLAGIAAAPTEEEFFFAAIGFTFPRKLYRYDPVTKEYVIYRSIENPINPDNYLIKQEWFKSKDGTDVPMFIFHGKSVSKENSNPTILYGYGGFGVGVSPSFLKSWIPWIERGGIFAIANIRGGNEFGSNWHKDGIKANKQNSYDDFISAGRHLISQEYTSSNKLGMMGGSNGGLLVSAVAVQEPELFSAVVSRVPLTDMVRFSNSGIAERWVHEYGNPKVKNELETILKWSPYHNVKKDVDYPNFLFTTAERDTRVDPYHARKMAAMLQSVQKDNDVLLFTDANAGHGPGKPVAKIIEGQARMLSFFMKYLGMSST